MIACLHSWSRRVLLPLSVLAVLAVLAAGTRAAASVPSGESCLDCHQGIEDMHPWYEVTCTGCHGGDPQATSKEAAHVRPRKPLPGDERLLPLDEELPYLAFRNPSDLRVVGRTCYECHTETVEHMMMSLHATTAGHLSDSLYENGLTRKKTTRYSIFPVKDTDGDIPEHGYASLNAYPQNWNPSLRGSLAGHAADLGRKNCMQCHLWGNGVGVRGRLGQDGNYRGAGCAACHVTYADNGLSRSEDPTVDRFEPGHPLTHTMTVTPPTETCTRCHFGDASIGLHFRGLAQLVPGMPAGPEVPGTTDSLLNGAYYINDPLLVPPDIHHEKGMHCVDCHTARDVMGDGNLYGFMEHAVEIECVDCHGTFRAPTDFRTSRGNPLTNLGEENGLIYLKSKVDGRKHWVPQAAYVVDPSRPEYNPKAARSMTERHEYLECYACHAGWNVNFFGFHFDRNESFTDLDLFTGQRTAGRCNTQEKVFATLKHFYLGFNDEGMVAPYLVGFSTMGTVHDEQGDKFLDQRMPETAAGLSGMTMVHHQLHSTRPTARQCVECHRSPSTLGLGSGNFRLTRDYAAVTDDLGLHLVAIDRENPEISAPLARVALPGARSVVARCDEIQGHFEELFVVLEGSGVAVVDARNPAFPRRIALIPCEDPRDLLLRADLLYVADGAAGLKIFDVEQAGSPRLLGAMPSAEARSLDLSFPYLFLADGPAGVKIVDVRDPAAPDFVGQLDLNGEPGRKDDAYAVRVTFQYSRPDDGMGERTQARKVAVVAAGRDGAMTFDVTEVTRPRRLYPPEGTPVGGGTDQRRIRTYTDVTLLSRFDLGSPGGDIPTAEHDYACFVSEEEAGAGFLSLLRITRPDVPRTVATRRLAQGARTVQLAAFYNPPFLQRFAVVTARNAAQTVNISNSEQPEILGPLFGQGLPVHGIAFEEFNLDRMSDERGRALKDISHEGARYFDRGELERLLTVPLDEADG